MSANFSDLPPRYLRTPEAARMVGLSIRTLEKHRGRVVYSVEDLQAWVSRGTKSSTSDPGMGTVLPAKRQLSPSPAASKPSRR